MSRFAAANGMLYRSHSPEPSYPGAIFGLGRWGFLAIHLDRAQPVGDFERLFTLYCPRQYERDALYVFTPDLMALMIDEAAPFDVEIVDQWLFVYSAQPFPLADAATYQRLLRIVSTVGAKALSQTDRYSDERIGVFAANLVAPAGQRLRSGTNWAGLIVIALIMTVWSIGIAASMLS